MNTWWTKAILTALHLNKAFLVVHGEMSEDHRAGECQRYSAIKRRPLFCKCCKCSTLVKYRQWPSNANPWHTKNNSHVRKKIVAAESESTTPHFGGVKKKSLSEDRHKRTFSVSFFPSHSWLIYWVKQNQLLISKCWGVCSVPLHCGGWVSGLIGKVEIRSSLEKICKQ